MTDQASGNPKREELLQAIRNLYGSSTVAPLTKRDHELCHQSALALEKLVLELYPDGEKAAKDPGPTDTYPDTVAESVAD